jgi:hypothetical protein
VTIVYVCLGIAVAIVAFMFWLIHTAPLGYEDENGFHYGEPPEKDD